MATIHFSKLEEIRDLLYEGSWKKMLEDLKSKLSAKPYDHRVAARIKEDIEAIEKTL